MTRVRHGHHGRPAVGLGQRRRRRARGTEQVHLDDNRLRGQVADVEELADKAQRWIADQFGWMKAPELATDGIDVLRDFSRSAEGVGLVEGRTGQHVIRETVEDYLRYITRGDDGIPTRLQLRAFEPLKVVMDSQRGFGQPRFEGSGARTAARILLGRAA